MFAVDPLKHSRKICGGMFSDLKKLVKRYPSDIKDMFHFQVHVHVHVHILYIISSAAVSVSVSARSSV